MKDCAVTTQNKGAHLSAKVLNTTEFIKTGDRVLGCTINGNHNGRQHPDLKALHQERALLCIDLDKLGLEVTRGQIAQVTIDNIATTSSRAEEVDDDTLASLYLREKLLLTMNFMVFTMTKSLPVLILDSLLAHGLTTAFTHLLKSVFAHILHLIKTTNVFIHLVFHMLEGLEHVLGHGTLHVGLLLLNASHHLLLLHLHCETLTGLDLGVVRHDI
mmetsp:Transcript_6992/g.13994  ORF Transcript_6992/g.13994 Transcript_6992/m.13994 type:complete len:216 (+) Transcript_6992:434-1081(+)